MQRSTTHGGALSAALLAGLLALAGCIGGDAPDLEPARDVASPSTGGAVPAGPLAQTWEGKMVVGAAFEIPAHFYPSDQLVKPIWSTGFVVEITDAPEILEVRVDWTSVGPTDIMLMVHGPHGAERPEERGWSEYVTHAPSEPRFAAEPPLCMRIPTADVRADLEAARHHGARPHWYPMVHSHHGADVKLTFTVTSVGGAVAIPDAVHGHDTNAEEILNIVETDQGPKRAWEPCAFEG